MGVRHGYGKIAGADALVFAYDTGDTRNSYKGEPTENLFGTTAMTFGSDNPTYTPHIENGTDSVGNYIIKDTVNAPWWSGLRVNQNGVNPLTAGVSYVVSFECRSPQYDWSWGLDANASGGGWSGNDLGRASNTNLVFDKTGGTVYTSDMLNTWQRVTYRVTMKDATTFTGASAYPHDSFFPNQNNIKVYYRNPQIEVGKTRATQYVNGARSATQGLLDLTGNTTIDLNTVSFDSNAQMTFDGTDDKAEVANFPHIWDGSFTVESVVNWNDDSRSIILGNYNVGANDINFEKLTGRRLRFYWNRGERDIFTPNDTVTTTGEYHHVVFTRDTTFRMYVNGNLITESSTDVGTDVTSTGSTFRIGGDTRDGTTIHNGDIPVVKAYNRALTAAEVKNNFNNYKGRFSI